MQILLLEPFMTGSHQQWAEGYAQRSKHKVHLLSLPGRHWKWRMHGGAISLAKQFLESDFRPDLVLASDMLDLSVFQSLCRNRLQGIPSALYFHENQIAYPWSPNDPDPVLQRDHHYSFINYTSALSADHLFFNSKYNRNSFLDGLPTFLGKFPDYQTRECVQGLRKKSRVLPLGLDLASLDQPETMEKRNGSPLILWNHRWEHDKGPDAFFDGLRELKKRGVEFRLAVLGENYSKAPACFEAALKDFGQEIVHWGYAKSRREYAHWLWQADFLPITSQQEFFGAAVVEAMYCGVRPLLPRRLAYPEHIPAPHQEELLYENNAWVERIAGWCHARPNPLPVRDWVCKYDWQNMAAVYDSVFERLIPAT
jgi:glycosyltransferase involved in cell wall biosynthesis